MANTSKREKTVKQLMVGNCWKYLHDNFHKFNQANKIKIALELCKKDVPQEIDGLKATQIVMMGEVKKGNDPMRFEIGDIDGLDKQRETSRVEEEE